MASRRRRPPGGGGGVGAGPLTTPSRLERTLDRLVSPTVGRRRWSAYTVCGFVGYLAGMTVTTALAARLGWPLAARLIIAFAPPVSLLVAVKISHIAAGHERSVAYENALAVVSTAGVGAWIVGASVASMIDVAVIGVGTFLAFGRVGCFRVGCCHGRRARRGVVYRHEHAQTGFPARWVGLRVAPVQLLDAALSASLAVTGFVLVWTGRTPGIAACVWIAGYGLGRWLIELARGDTDRPTLLGVSEAQWLAWLTALGAALWRPAWWTLGCASALGIGVGVLAVARRRGALVSVWLAGPWHAAEVAACVEHLAHGGPPATTHEGVQLSAANLPDGRLDVVLSRPGRPLPASAVAALAAQLGRPWLAAQVVTGATPGLLHVVLERESAPVTSRDGLP